MARVVDPHGWMQVTINKETVMIQPERIDSLSVGTDGLKCVCTDSGLTKCREEAERLMTKMRRRQDAERDTEEDGVPPEPQQG